MKPTIMVIMGSASDMDVMEEAVKVLREFKIPHDVEVVSAHRTPERAAEIARTARDAGIMAIIAGAGCAAHLAGFVAAHTTLPVIGVPIDAGPLRGVDAMLSTLQMPGGIPVATMAIGKAGARNAALLAASILSLHDETVKAALERFRTEMGENVAQKAREIRERLGLPLNPDDA